MMRLTIIIAALCLLFLNNSWAMEISSDAFKEGAYIPSQYTCDSANISPMLSWKDIPQETKSLVLICEDPDAPTKVWTHWVIYNISADTKALAKDVPNAETFNGATQGMNDFGKIGYSGPCPPPGNPHRYFFKLYAIDTTLKLYRYSTKQDVLEAIKGHIAASAETFGIYGR